MVGYKINFERYDDLEKTSPFRAKLNVANCP